ncbi:MAG: 5-(carboxyamino)imidazole ribonucleotide mutase [Nitrospira bacterium HGW-Nitrospira-1]|nr:MAG: 5-(carboxyamino)imidazole ribonucleotide mutase [Nitrospira bacterium HGW-Nitrospira-1]
MKPKVLIIMGSDSDLPVMEETARILDEFNIPYTMTVSSAHRTPVRTLKLIKDAGENGIDVIIGAAGMAAHLPGVIASHTVLPVIGVPLEASPLKGMDALLSIVQMPAGIPVATVSVGKAGAKNAAILAVQIIALNDPKLTKKLQDHRQKMAKEVEEKADRIAKKR